MSNSKQVMDNITQELQNPNPYSNKILNLLWDLRRKAEFQQHLSDAEFFDIVGETFSLNPNFFLNSIYPKMKAWTFPSFLSIKEEIIEHIEILLEFYH